MKMIRLILMSLILMLCLSTSAFAIDAKLSGEFYVAGLYQDKTSLVKDAGPSTAFYFQRLRLNAVFIVSPGLTLVTRADIMERAWGASRSNPGTTLDTASQGTRAENENIAFDRCYVQYASSIGIIAAGYQPDGGWATVFGNTPTSVGKVSYVAVLPISLGTFYLGVDTGKNAENSYTAINNVTTADRDSSFYSGFAIFGWKNGDAGLYVRYTRDATARILYKGDYFWIAPYLRAKWGIVSLQAEANYFYGKLKMENGVGGSDISIGQLQFWIDATANFSMLYVGGSLAFVPGDDPGTADKIEGGWINGGRDWNPCLIMFNSDRSYWAGSITSYDATRMDGPMNNTWFFQGRVGVKPVAKLDVMTSLSYAHADKTPAGTWAGRGYGWEIDLTGTYKITDNLSYLLGGGYWIAGDFFYGTTSNNRDLNNNFMIINKLTLTF